MPRSLEVLCGLLVLAVLAVPATPPVPVFTTVPVLGSRTRRMVRL